MSKVYSHTQALCPQCRQKTTARYRSDHNAVYLEKFCPDHGFSRVLVSSDVSWYESSRFYVKPGQEPLKRNVAQFKGCPESCGLCPQHQQHTCLPVIEINSLCQMDCPVCLKNPGPSFSLSLKQFQSIIRNLFETEGTVTVINLSGGEPTLHPQLEAMIDYALQEGVAQVSVSTNGMKLLKDPTLQQMFKRTGTIAAVQMDGFSETASRLLRGEETTAWKRELIRLMESEDIRYSLTATVAKGINDHEITALTDFFFQSRALSLMFHPIVFTGHAEVMEREKYRLTVPCVVKEIEKSPYASTGDFNPLPCSHFSCFALSYYLVVGDGRFVSLKKFLGEADYLDICANKTLPGLDGKGSDVLSHRLMELWSAADASDLAQNVLQRVKTVLRSLQQDNPSHRQKIALGAQHMKAIFIHHFMDVDTMDLGRLAKCCNPYPQLGDRLIPMCAENVFFNFAEPGGNDEQL